MSVAIEVRGGHSEETGFEINSLSDFERGRGAIDGISRGSQGDDESEGTKQREREFVFSFQGFNTTWAKNQ
jgi:hypothetical protein